MEIESNENSFKPYLWLLLMYLSLFIGLFAFYDQSYNISMFCLAIFGYSWRAFSHIQITIICKNNEKCIVLEKKESGTCLECPNCGEFYTLWHRHGKYCSGCGQRIIPPEDWEKYI